MKELFYTVDPQLDSIDGYLECNGWKTLTLYNIVNNHPKMLAELDVPYSHSSIGEIQFWLDENGYEDGDYNFTRL